MKTFSCFGLLAGLALFSQGCSFNHFVAKDYPRYLKKHPPSTPLPLAPIPAAYHLTPSTATHRYEFHAASVGYANAWIVQFGEILKDYLGSAALQCSFGELEPAEPGCPAPDILVFDLVDYSFSHGRAQLSLDVRCLRGDQVLLSKVYSAEGDSHLGRMNLEGAFGMKNLVLDSTTSALDGIFRALIADLGPQGLGSAVAGDAAARDEQDFVPAHRAPKAAPRSGFYGFVGSGEAWISSYDLVNYYQIAGASSAANSWPRQGDFDEQFDLGAGYHSASGAGLELRLAYLDRGDHGRFYSSGDPAQAANMAGFDFNLAPGYSLSLGLGHRNSLFLAWQLGMGLFMAKRVQGDNTGHEEGSYYIRATDMDWGPLARWQAPLGPALAVGIELGYRVESFSDLPVSSASGFFSGRGSPDKTLRGTDAFFDNSGPFLNLNLMFGRLP